MAKYTASSYVTRRAVAPARVRTGPAPVSNQASAMVPARSTAIQAGAGSSLGATFNPPGPLVRESTKTAELRTRLG